MSDLAIHLLGELRIRLAGVEQALPPSRKTRALLAYLVLTGRPHRRERLCELFWDLPDDPRGSLRWALSKLRPLVDGPETARIIADRERAAFDRGGAQVDLWDIRHRLAAPDPISIADLVATATALDQPLLDGLDQPQLEAFQAWLVAEREDAARLRRSVLQRLVRHPDCDEYAMLKWARIWWQADPLCDGATSALVRALKRLGRTGEAEDVVRAYADQCLAAGLTPVSDLLSDRSAPEPPTETAARRLLQHQSISFTKTPDGIRIAYATVGKGPPIVKAANWLNHLELDWQSPIWARSFQALAAQNTLVRYDGRGNGLSDWATKAISFDAFVTDLETVVDTVGLQDFPLLGLSQGAAVSIAYAARHPERVRALVLIGGYATGWRIGATPEERERREAVMTLTRHGWGTSNPAYRHIFSQTFMPEGTAEELAWFDEFQRLTTSAENAVRFQDVFGDIDVRPLLPQIKVPTLVLHARDDQRIRVDQGRELAAMIPNARFVTLESSNHILLGREPAWEVCAAEISRFLTGLSTQGR
jgi:pimeloyl-ACP methyl ester carboxylesterase/DNA-binding SARP family transcriptional activator